MANSHVYIGIDVSKDSLVKAGKAKKAAPAAVMRKLLCLMRRIAQDPEFVPAQG